MLNPVLLVCLALGMSSAVRRPLKFHTWLERDGNNAEMSSYHSLKHVRDQQRFEETWQRFKDKFHKQYTAKEELTRKVIFRANLKIIRFHNYLYRKNIKSFQLGINEYADMNRAEFVGVMNGFRSRNRTSEPHRSTFMSKNFRSLPDFVDWRTKGYVTGVKNQKKCGSCWAFSTTGSLEGQHFRKTRSLVSLSEQNLVDCSTSYGNHGCRGGNVDQAFKFIRDNQGLDTESDYPYSGQDGTCRFDPSGVGATLIDYTDLPSGDEDALKEATATIGPISIAIDASHKSFRFYHAGVYMEPMCSQMQLDHAVLIVGYGTEGGQDYWLVKNSWGTSWGMNGYIKMARNQDNQCGVASQASYPNV